MEFEKSSQRYPIRNGQNYSILSSFNKTAINKKMRKNIKQKLQICGSKVNLYIPVKTNLIIKKIG